MVQRLNPTIILSFLVLVITACQPIARPPDATGTIPIAPVQLALVPAAQTETLPASDIFATISPSVAFLETPSATGSGVLVDHGYILSNAHVVWPYQQVRVVFPDGSEYLDTPVHSWDLTADLALIGPHDVPQSPVALTDGGELAIGADIYLIGYPAEVDEFPQPTITNGILSRVRTWEAIDYSFFQVDATTVGGQSGGILVTHKGEVIGVSTFYYGGFGLAGSVADTIHRLNAMLGNESDVVIDMRPIQGSSFALSHTGVLAGDWDTKLFILDEPVDTEIELTLRGFGRPRVSVMSLEGYYVDTVQLEAEEEDASLAFTVEEETPYLIEVSQGSTNRNTFALDSSHPLGLYEDPDDNRMLTLDSTIMGSMETVRDIDRYEIELAKDEIVQITVDALEIDPFIRLTYQSNTLEESVSDDDSGGGMFGQSAQLTYKAPEDGTYQISIRNYDNSIGTYFVTVATAAANAELTEPVTTRELFGSGAGKLTWYEDEEYNFAVLRPAEWSEVPGGNCAPGATACYVGPAVFLITEEPLSQLPKRDRNREGYLSVLTDAITLQPGVEITERETVTTLQKLSADEFTFSVQLGRAKGKRFIYVDEDQQVAFNVTIVSESAMYPLLESFIDYTFETFRKWNPDALAEDAVYHLDRGARFSMLREYQDALTSYDESIALDPTLVQAYASRAWTHYYLDNSTAAIADLEKAIALDPMEIDRYLSLGIFYWRLHDYPAALTTIDEGIDIDPERVESYNQRALIHVALNEYDAALADIEEYEAHSEGELSPGVIDTRAFVYLMMGNSEKAKEDYEETYRKDFRSEYTLLGGGIAYAQLGDLPKAKELIIEGYERFDEAEHDDRPLNPQLAALFAMAQEIVPKE